MATEADMIPASKAYEEFGLPRSMLRDLAERGIIKSAERSFDICHTIKLYSRKSIINFLDKGGEND